MNFYQSLGDFLADSESSELQKLKALFANPGHISQILNRMQRLLDNYSPIREEIGRIEKILSVQGANHDRFGRQLRDLRAEQTGIEQNVDHICELAVQVKIPGKSVTKNVKIGKLLHAIVERKALSDSTFDRSSEDKAHVPTSGVTEVQTTK